MLIFEGKCIFENKPSPVLVMSTVEERGGGLFSGGYGNLLLLLTHPHHKCLDLVYLPTIENLFGNPG